MTTNAEPGTVERLRAWAKGSLPLEASIELLIRAFDGRFARTSQPWIRVEPNGATGLDDQFLASGLGELSGGERRVLSIVVALADTTGARGIGDPYYADYGNGGYDVDHYDIRVSYVPRTDRLAGTTTRVDAVAGGTAQAATMSDDGRYVVTIVSGTIRLHDRVAATTTTLGTASAARRMAISGDGSQVAFTLSNGSSSVRDVAAGTTSAIGAGDVLALSGDGRYLVWRVGAGIVRRDLTTSTTVSVRALAVIRTDPMSNSTMAEIGSGVSKTGMAVPSW